MSPDTIVARATGAGVAAVAVVRLSGPQSLQITNTLLGEARLPAPGHLAVRWLVKPGSAEVIDQAVISVFTAPRSYTGEDVVEISCHGGPLLSARVIAACEALGARAAEPGEFTRRAYLNGRMDLIQVEAVADLIEGDSEALNRAALHQLDRGLSARLAELREAVVSLEALLTHHIDFPDEDEPPVPIQRIVVEAAALGGQLESLAATAPEGELLREGVTTVLAGPPNSGKSSLFNALVGHDRAIVTKVPGTTRDALEARVSLGGFPFLLVDTAGLRESDDSIERMGIEVAERYLASADLVLLCNDVGAREHAVPIDLFDGLAAKVVRVTTKVDTDPGHETVGGNPLVESDGAYSVRVSAMSGEGLDALRTLLPTLAFKGLVHSTADVPVLTRARQRRGVEAALTEVRAFGQALADGVPAEVASTHLRPAATALEELLGVIPNDEVLDRVFRDFCIGK